MYIILAAITGGLVILSMIINSRLADKIGVFQGTLVNYIVGLTFTLVLVILMKGPKGFITNNLGEVPFYGFLGGFIGVMVVATSNIIIPKIPAIYSALLIFIGQVFTGIIIDYIRLSSVSKGKIIGGLIIILGLLYNTSLDKKDMVKEKEEEKITEEAIIGND
ncbi:DMT family transporter [Clostridium peptidivorans]|uniref:DMT family transporter n=1 Tax=Clostridium peptidivorans TaxID=100174 RepID=UPI000BE2E812|nr:DMT family transporter [Clostridium peptidivorans]